MWQGEDASCTFQQYGSLPKSTLNDITFSEYCDICTLHVCKLSLNSSDEFQFQAFPHFLSGLRIVVKQYLRQAEDEPKPGRAKLGPSSACQAGTGRAYFFRNGNRLGLARTKTGRAGPKKSGLVQPSNTETTVVSSGARSGMAGMAGAIPI